VGAAAHEERIRRIFAAQGEAVVLPKGLVERVPALTRVPRYVAEFLLARSPDPEAQLADVADYVARLTPLPPDREFWRSRLVRDGRVEILEEILVEVDVRHGVYHSHLASLDVHVAVAPAVVERYPELLAGGLWGRARVERLVDPDTGVATLELSQFHPVQVRARVDAFIENRYYFNAREWINLLIVSSGYDPGVLTESAPDPTSALRLRLLALTRLAPVVEPSLHLLELGPRNTGKTYLLRSLSNRVFVLSGSRGTPATLFVNLASHTPGILVQRDVVVFDEVARLHLGSAETLATLKDFLETGTFTRGSQALRSQSSTVFLGNIEVDAGQPSHRYRSLVEPLPEELRDVAFLDRLHGYLPGWEMPKLRPESFARGLGLVSDYFGEVLLRLRDHPFEARFRAIVDPYPLKSGMTQRDRVAVERMARALLKLVFPHGETAGEEDVVRAILSLAGELRQRVHAALVHLAPGEFAPRAIGYEGVPSPTAADLSRTEPAGTLRLSQRPGAAHYLDAGSEGMEGAGELRAVEVTILPARGLHLHGSASDGAAKPIRLMYDALKANLRVLGLPLDWLSERGLAVQVVGAIRDADALALPVLLAMASAARRAETAEPLLGCGVVTLHGRLYPPPDLRARLRHLPERGHLVVPAPARPVVEILDLPSGLRVTFVADLVQALRSV
jgi:ATP-dependent Lon protease